MPSGEEVEKGVAGGQVVLDEVQAVRLRRGGDDDRGAVAGALQHGARQECQAPPVPVPHVQRPAPVTVVAQRLAGLAQFPGPRAVGRPQNGGDVPAEGLLGGPAEQVLRGGGPQQHPSARGEQGDGDPERVQQGRRLHAG